MSRNRPEQTGAFHEHLEALDEIKGPSDRSFGFVFATVFGLLGGWLLFGGSHAGYLAVAASALFLLTALLRPSWLAPLNHLWTRFGLLLHKIVSPVVLGFLFFVVITPMGLARKAFGEDPLKRKFDPNASSYWIEQEPGPEPETMRNQF